MMVTIDDKIKRPEKAFLLLIMIAPTSRV